MPCLHRRLFLPSLRCRLFCRVSGIHGESNIEKNLGLRWLLGVLKNSPLVEGCPKGGVYLELLYVAKPALNPHYSKKK
jgi:hypothetical protein